MWRSYINKYNIIYIIDNKSMPTTQIKPFGVFTGTKTANQNTNNTSSSFGCFGCAPQQPSMHGLSGIGGGSGGGGVTAAMLRPM